MHQTFFIGIATLCHLYTNIATMNDCCKVARSECLHASNVHFLFYLYHLFTILLQFIYC